MVDQSIVGAVLLGVVEGLTEFLPVSSTAHVLLAEHFSGFAKDNQTLRSTFAVLIQLGAILAIVIVYFQRLLRIALAAPYSPKARQFIGAILLAFLPAVVVGAIAHDFIKTVLFESPATMCIALIVGGVILLFVDRMPLQPKYTNVMDYPPALAFKIGLFQCLAMIPGTSRSGATIVGSLLMGTDKRSAAEFSFFLAMPTMGAAFAKDLWDNHDALDFSSVSLIAIGFVSAFICGLIVVRGLLDFVSRRGFAVFGWWRILVGFSGLIGLYLMK